MNSGALVALATVEGITTVNESPHGCDAGALGIIRPYITWETVQKDFFNIIDYEGVIIISIRVLRREIARASCPITF